MKHQDMQELIDKAESELLQLSDTISTLRSSMEELMEQNNQLELKYQQLTESILKRKDHANQNDAMSNKKGEGENAHHRLQQFYEDGIHICHDFFGMPIAKEEECLFCNKFLDELQNKDQSSNKEH